MKTHLAALTLAAALAQPTSATTFPSLTTIYVGAGVIDSGGINAIGKATCFHCANVSGLTATIRFLVLDENGAPSGAFTTSLGHGTAITVSTHATNSYIETHNLNTDSLNPGVVNIESTQSGVFCTAETLDAEPDVPNSVSRHLVRVNPHPGTVE